MNEIDATESFWVKFPAYKVLIPFDKLYKNDVSTGEDHGSRSMWFQYYCWHPDSPCFDMLEKAKLKLVCKSLFEGGLTDYHINKKALNALEADFRELCLKTAERAYSLFVKQMLERQTWIAGLKYSASDADMLDATWGRYEKLVKIEKVLKDNCATEKLNKGRAKGNKVLSLGDTGET